MKRILILMFMIALSGPIGLAQTVTDFDGNIYTTVTIGTQVWMQQNLNVKHYRNGDPIPEVQDSIAWVDQTEGAWCYNENSSANGQVYGALYNWYAANDPRNIAPVGWHLPSDEEWKILEMFLGMPPATTSLDQYRGTTEGNALKEAGTTTHWTLDCCPGHALNEGTNSSGFSALGGGFRWYYNAGAPYISFSPPTGNAQFWTSTEQHDTTAWLRHLCVYHEDIYRASWKKSNGSSVRLVKDVSLEVGDADVQQQLRVYPNPTTTQLTVSLIINEPTTITLYDVFAQQILQVTFLTSTTRNTEQLAAGMYFYELRNHKATSTTGIVVKR